MSKVFEELMSKIFEDFIEKLSEKSGYSYDFLVDRYNEMNDELGYVDMEEFYSITMDHAYYKRMIDMECTD